MKDYDHHIVWREYFNRNLPRSGGRRMPREMCVGSPTADELASAAKAAGFEVTESNERARYPRAPRARSAYVAIPKSSPKSKALRAIAAKLAEARSKGRK